MKIPTRRPFIFRAASNLLDTMNDNPWLLPAAVGLVVMIVNYP